MAQAGIDLYQISKLLGHKDIKMTQRYSHHCPDSLRNGVEVLDKVITFLSQSNEKGLTDEGQLLYFLVELRGNLTRFAIRELGATDITYGSAVLPGAMFLVAYLRPEINTPHSALRIPHSEVPILGIPACGMYARTTIFDLVLPRVLAGERIGRRELAELGHGGLCMKCEVCRYSVCPFGK